MKECSLMVPPSYSSQSDHVEILSHPPPFPASPPRPLHLNQDQLASALERPAHAEQPRKSSLARARRDDKQPGGSEARSQVRFARTFLEPASQRGGPSTPASVTATISDLPDSESPYSPSVDSEPDTPTPPPTPRRQRSSTNRAHRGDRPRRSSAARRSSPSPEPVDSEPETPPTLASSSSRTLKSSAERRITGTRRTPEEPQYFMTRTEPVRYLPPDVMIPGDDTINALEPGRPFPLPASRPFIPGALLVTPAPVPMFVATPVVTRPPFPATGATFMPAGAYWVSR